MWKRLIKEMFGTMSWDSLVRLNKDLIVHDTQEFLRIESVLDEKALTVAAPFGEGIREAYDWLLHKARKDGFKVKDLDGYAAHIEWGTGEEIIGVLCHIDVVPGGDDWTTPAFAAEIRDEKIYARGAIDDKGPTMACYYAMKLLKESGVSIGKRVRLIIGTDEESQWRCVDHYFKHEKMPTMGFAPDADFPIIYAEKGICDIYYHKKFISLQGMVQSFQSGHRLNMVPDRATVVLDLRKVTDQQDLKLKFDQFNRKYECKGEIETNEEGSIKLTIHGVSAHGMEPDAGVNAGLLMARFLMTLSLSADEESYFQPLSTLFFEDSRGKNAGITYCDKEMGDVTINVGEMIYEAGGESTVGLNIRYPEGASFEKIKTNLDHQMSKNNFSGTIRVHDKPHAIDKNHKLVETLSKVYEEYTGEKANLLAIGGGTYARSLDAGVAFGPLFPGQIDVIHQADEFISIEHLLSITAIYAGAIYELAK